MRPTIIFATLAAAAVTATALQFDIVPGAQHCFTEDIAPGTAVAVSYVVVDGAGDLPITLQVRHVPSDSLVYARDAIESGKFSFVSPTARPDFRANLHQALPPAGDNAGSGGSSSSGAFAVRSEEGASGSKNANPAAQGQAPPSVGRDAADAASDKTLAAEAKAARPLGASTGDDDGIGSYSFCFGKTLSHGSGLLHLFPMRPFGGGGAQESRRIIFDLVTGEAAARAPPGAHSLAKELHLTESDRLFTAVHAHVAEVVGQVDRMRTSARDLDEMHAATGVRVTMYSILTCICIMVTGVLSVQGTNVLLRRQKDR